MAFEKQTLVSYWVKEKHRQQQFSEEESDEHDEYEYEYEYEAEKEDNNDEEERESSQQEKMLKFSEEERGIDENEEDVDKELNRKENLKIQNYTTEMKITMGKKYNCYSPTSAPLKTFGCKHYQKNCFVFAECCQRWYVCRHCHDEIEDADDDMQGGHKMNRYNAKLMKCMFCQMVQNCAQFCVNSECKRCMAKYYCDVCHLWDNTPHKNIFHCEKCHLCRIGKIQDFIHCSKCDACLHKTWYRRHKCVEKVLKSDCPVCHEYLHNSLKPVTFWNPCSHPLHIECFRKYVQTNELCAYCRVRWQPLAPIQNQDNNDETTQNYH